MSSSPGSQASTQEWVDFDELNLGDPQAVSEYAASICKHLYAVEHERRASPAYLETLQSGAINPRMRAIVVDWLVEVSEEYELCTDTLYQAVNYMDRYLSRQAIDRKNLQLVGVTCMWVASKYEEKYPPTVSDFCEITDNTYTKAQLIQTEEHVLKTLSYELTVPTAKTFLRRLLQVCSPDRETHMLANYLTELSLLDYGMLEFVPSVVAASAVFLTNVLLGRLPWSANLHHYSTYLPIDLRHCVVELANVHRTVSPDQMSPQHLTALYEKYGKKQFLRASTFPHLDAVEIEKLFGIPHISQV